MGKTAHAEPFLLLAHVKQESRWRISQILVAYWYTNIWKQKYDAKSRCFLKKNFSAKDYLGGADCLKNPS
jgi:hypothetical protein